MRTRALTYTIAFAIVGVIITLLIFYVQRNTLKTYERNLPYISLGDNVKNRSLKAHLSMEEIFLGDASLNFEKDVMLLLTTSQSILQGAYNGKETEIGNFNKPDDDETLAILKEASIELDKLIAETQERWQVFQKFSNTDENTIRDTQFDAAFNRFNDTLDRLIIHMNDRVEADHAYLNYFSWLSIVLILLVFVVLSFLIYRSQHSTDKLADENYKRLENQEQAVSSLSSFIESISAGNYSIDLQMEGDENLKKTLITMRDKLRANAEDDRKRNWSTSGLAQIGEILRASTHSTEELFDNIIKFVVKYTKSNQGGLFILNEESENEKYLELVACYAFERKKYLTRRVNAGEGLIGQCYLEGERIYLLHVPHEYIRITSGLGGSNPNALLIVPLKINEKIYGVLELATFGNYDAHEIEFVEKLGESIASTISNVRVNESTRILLEKTQQQAEEMRAQEEEMRQNMEELEATQEEMRRKEKHIQQMLELEKRRNEFNQKSREVLLDLSKNKDVLKGRWDEAMEKITSGIARHLKISRASIWRYDRHENKLICEKLYNADKKVFEAGAELNGNDFPDYFKTIKGEQVLIAKDAWMHADTRELADTYLKPLDIQSVISVPFFSEGKMAGLICCEHQREQIAWADDHAEFLKSCSDLITVTLNTTRINSVINELSDAKETMQTIIDNLPRAVFWKDKELRIQGCNKIFAQVAGMSSPQEMIGHTDFEMPWREHAEAYRADDMAVMNSRQARIDQEERNVNSEGVESWVLTSKVPVMNKKNEVVAVLGMFEDITERKQKEADVQAKLKELEELKNKSQLIK